MTGTLSDGRDGRGVSYAARLRAIVRGGSVKAQHGTLVIEENAIDQMIANKPQR